jgi:hypothetical protein
VIVESATSPQNVRNLPSLTSSNKRSICRSEAVPSLFVQVMTPPSMKGTSTRTNGLEVPFMSRRLE